MRIAISTGGGDAPGLNVLIADAIATPRRVPLDSDTIMTARDLGVSFGD